MKIFFTGASSFTGYWFTKTLAEAGHDITATFTRLDLDAYTDPYRLRVEKLLPLVRALWNTAMGSETMLSAIESNSYELLCLHGAVVGNHKAPDFDVLSALQQNTHNLPSVLAQFKAAGGKAVISTGTYFEADEGIGTEPRQAFSPYALSKTLTWQAIRFQCHQFALPLAKFVVANPFGSLEKGGFTQYLIQSWRKGEQVSVRTPDYIRDNVPVDLMALHYLELCEELQEKPESGSHNPVAPSWFTGSQGDFTGYFAEKFHQMTGLSAPFELAQQTDFSEPLDRRNREQPVDLHSHQWSEADFWAGYLRGRD